ncbi:MAG: HNH endonuclease, partial [Clostridia bacterium]|nr:HNH endonuclease [Clostridia bacterium]
RDKKTGYYLSSKKIGRSRKRLHVYVWEYYNGKVPYGHHVHHADEDKGNNEIENLVIIKAADHAELHGDSADEKTLQKKRENLCRNAVPKAKEWHRSEEGQKWHSEHAKQTQANMQSRQYVCTYCGNVFETTKAYKQTQNTFCSNKCKAAYRRKMGYDDVSKICEVCGNEYTANKYQKTKRCPVCRDKKNRV